MKEVSITRAKAVVNDEGNYIIEIQLRVGQFYLTFCTPPLSEGNAVQLAQKIREA